MPSAAQGTCLQRHEWFKHGTCQTDWDVSEYYSIAVNLTQQFNNSGIAKWIQSNVGNLVSTEAFIQEVDSVLGANAHKRLQLTCKKGNLVDVYINLPRDIGDNPSLANLISSANEDYRNNCGDHFRIDRIGVGK